jgi:carboxynorspermidine decarboxylase
MSPVLPPGVATPAYVLDLARLKQNLATAARVRAEAGCRVLFATKSFALPAVFALMRQSLDGTTASGVYEARCAARSSAASERLRANVHGRLFVRSSALPTIRRADRAVPAARARRARWQEIGIRFNTGYSNATLGGALYDPCAPLLALGRHRRPAGTS